MVVTKNEWSNITLYIKDKVCEHLTDNKIDKLTLIGLLQELTLEDFLSRSEVKREKKKPTITPGSLFKEFWEAYPPTASFNIKGMRFQSARVLRSNYQICEQLYNKAIHSGSVTHEDLMKALKKQVNMMKQESFETGLNKLQYFSAIEVYLRQGKYESFVGADEDDEDNYSSNCI